MRGRPSGRHERGHVPRLCGFGEDRKLGCIFDPVARAAVFRSEEAVASVAGAGAEGSIGASEAGGQMFLVPAVSVGSNGQVIG